MKTIGKTKCPNLNHTKANVVIRFCCSCGEVVNAKLHVRSCTEISHKMQIKERIKYCMDCGKPLFKGSN